MFRRFILIVIFLIISFYVYQGIHPAWAEALVDRVKNNYNDLVNKDEPETDKIIIEVIEEVENLISTGDVITTWDIIITWNIEEITWSVEEVTVDVDIEESWLFDNINEEEIILTWETSITPSVVAEPIIIEWEETDIEEVIVSESIDEEVIVSESIDEEVEETTPTITTTPPATTTTTKQVNTEIQDTQDLINSLFK